MSTNLRKKYYEDGDGNNDTIDRDTQVRKSESGASADGDEEEERTMYEFVIGHLDKFFVEHIPVASLKELPPVYMYYGGFVAYVSAFALFAYFVATSYLAAMEQSYIATDKTSGQCESVSIAVTGSYLADAEGNWVGSPDFLYSRAKYDISFNNFQVTSYTQYIDMMETFEAALLAMGAQANIQNLPYNLLIWISFIKFYSVEFPTVTNFTSIGTGQLQSIQMTGNAKDVFDLGNQIVSIGSTRGNCPMHAGTDFDKANALIKTTLNFYTYSNLSRCNDALPPVQYGYASAIDDGEFDLSLNVETFSMAMAVNLGIVSLSDLSLASLELIPLNFHNTDYLLGQYFDNRNLDMIPMSCMYNVSAIPPGEPNIQYLCFYLWSRTVALPVFNHVGTSNFAPAYCACGINGYTDDCNDFNLMAGLLIYPLEDTSVNPLAALSYQINQLMMMMAKFDGDYQVLNEAAYNASWTVATDVFGSQSVAFTTDTWFETAFDFCSLGTNNSCSLLIFNALDTDSSIVTDYKYSLFNGSCSDSISITAADWNKLEAEAPVQLTQDYYKCYPTRFSAFFNALGIASGNTALAVPLIVVVLLPVMYAVLILIQQLPPKDEYTPLEKEQAVDILALILLRLRDGKTRGIRKGGVLQQLTKELVTAAKEEGGFPDSDDDDDDEEDFKSKVRKNKSITIKTFTPGKRDDDDDDDPPPPDSDDELDEEEEARIRASMAARRRRRSSSRRRSSANGMRRSSVGEGGGGGGGKKRRNRLGVFVKQLEEPSRGAQNKRGSLNGDNNEHPPASSMFGFMFGSSSSSTMEKRGSAAGLEMDSFRASQVNPLMKVIDLSKERLPTGVRILNEVSAEEARRSRKQLKPEHLETLVADLLARFAEALSGREGEARSSPSYAQGCIVARQLANVDYDAFVSHENLVMFLKLSNALCMHASIELQCEMRELETKYADRIAYNIGNHVLTAATMSAMLA